MQLTWTRSVLWLGLLVSAMGAVRPQASPTLVEGRVVDAGSGDGIGGATVSAGMNPWTPVRRVRSDPDGHFVLADIPPATPLHVWALKPGYGGGRYGQRSPQAPFIPIEVQKGERLDHVELPLWRHAVIAGVVRDEQGEPLARMPVVALSPDWRTGKRRLVLAQRMIRTNDRGEYRLSSLPPGTYTIAVPTGDAKFVLEQPGLPTPYATVFYPAADLASSAAPIAVGAGDVLAGIDFTLLPSPGQTIEGRIDANRSAELWTVELIATGGQVPTALDARSALVDPAGRFRFGSVPPGTYRLLATAFPTRGTVRVVGGVEVQAFRPGEPPPPVPAGDTLWAEETLQVGDQPIPEVVLHPSPGARVSGRFRFEGSTSAAVAQALTMTTVSLLPADGGNLIGETAATVDGQGRFTTAGLPPGCYWVTLRFPTADWTLASLSLANAPLPGGCVPIASSDVTGLDIEMTARPSHIRGVVRDGSGRLLPLAPVLAFATRIDRRSAAPSVPTLRQTYSDRHGEYTMTGLPPGDYYVVAPGGEIPRDWMNPDYLRTLMGQAAVVHVEVAQTHTQDLKGASR